MSRYKGSHKLDIERGWKICNNVICENKYKQLSLDKFYLHNSNGYENYDTKCKDCRIKQSKEYANKNRTLINKRKKHNYYANKEKCRRQQKKYYLKNIEKIRERDRLRGKTPESRQKRREYRKRWYQENKEQYRSRRNKWLEKNKEKNRAYKKKYRDNNKHKTRLYQKEKRNRDPNYKIKQNLRHRIWMVLKGYAKSENTLKLLGCSFEEFKNYIESKFKKGMNWDNYNYETWHIDHIIPCDAFDLSKKEEQRKCFHYSNLQPLWATTEIAHKYGDFESVGNLEKSNKII